MLEERNINPQNNEQPSAECAQGHAHEHQGTHHHVHEDPREVLLEQKAEILQEEVEILQEEVAILEEELELIEIELFCRDNPGKQPPPAKKYRIRVDGTKIDMPIPEPTGREILLAAGKAPEKFLLNQKICGRIQPIGLDDKVDLRAPGVERFMTLPKDQTEGRSAARRAFELPEEDTALLNAGGHDWETVESNGRWLLIHYFPLPTGFTAASTSAAIQIPSGYPSAALDMVYFCPPVVRADGRPIARTECSVNVDGKQWQRWSRHYTSANPWKLGEYNVVTHHNLARTWVEAASK